MLVPMANSDFRCMIYEQGTLLRYIEDAPPRSAISHTYKSTYTLSHTLTQAGTPSQTHRYTLSHSQSR